MSRRNKVILLVALLAVLAVVLYSSWRGPSALTARSLAGEQFRPLDVENPALRVDKIARIRTFEYSGRHRNIFSAELPPPPAPKTPEKAAPATPPPPPPLEVPVKFFGYVADAASGHRRAFFTNGEDVFIVAEGETLLNRFRLLRIANATAEVEEIASGRRATLVLEQPGPSA